MFSLFSQGFQRFQAEPLLEHNSGLMSVPQTLSEHSYVTVCDQSDPLGSIPPIVRGTGGPGVTGVALGVEG